MKGQNLVFGLEAAVARRGHDRFGKVPDMFIDQKGLKNLQESEKSYSEAIQTISDAIKQGVDTYLDERDKSASEKKDGALEDLFINSAKGVSVAVETGSSAIYDVAKSMDSYLITDRQRKDIKRSIRSISRLRLPILPIPYFIGSSDDDDDEDDD